MAKQRRAKDQLKGKASPAKPLAPTLATAGLAPQDVNQLPLVSGALAAKIKAAAGVTYGPRPALAPAAQPQPAAVTKPGVERWPVKTGTDPDIAQVKPQIVPTTVEELISIPRPSDMQPVTEDFPQYQQHRAQPVETTIWQIEVVITALKQETDGDYHLVLQGASGETMIGEIPTPRAPFVGSSSPWLANINAARAAVDQKLVKPLKPSNFVPMAGKLVPRESMVATAEPPASSATSFTTQSGAGAAFKTRVSPTKARITGVGFFDKVHGQMGVSQFNGIELHPVLKVEWI